MRLTEEEVADRLRWAYAGGLFSGFVVDCILRSHGTPCHEHPKALAAVGVRWNGTHYEEVG